MDRRDVVTGSVRAACSVGLAGIPASMASIAFAADAKLKPYAKALLVNAQGEPIKAASLKARTNYIFHYPFEGTPVFLLDLGKAVAGKSLETRDKSTYAWPGGVGKARSIVAFSAICAHKLVYPTPALSFISFRAAASSNPVAYGTGENLIHCCADHSQYDPAQGAQVLRGPATQPLCAVLLTHDPKSDTLTAHATLGGELFDEFFTKYEAKLSLDMGGKAKNTVTAKTTVREMDQFCKNTIRC